MRSPWAPAEFLLEGCKVPPPPPPIEKRGPEREKIAERPPHCKKIPMKEKNVAESTPPPPHREKAPHKEKINSKKPPLYIIVFIRTY